MDLNPKSRHLGSNQFKNYISWCFARFDWIKWFLAQTYENWWDCKTFTDNLGVSQCSAKNMRQARFEKSDFFIIEKCTVHLFWGRGENWYSNCFWKSAFCTVNCCCCVVLSSIYIRTVRSYLILCTL